MHTGYLEISKNPWAIHSLSLSRPRVQSKSNNFLRPPSDIIFILQFCLQMENELTLQSPATCIMSSAVLQLIWKVFICVRGDENVILRHCFCQSCPG